MIVPANLRKSFGNIFVFLKKLVKRGVIANLILGFLVLASTFYGGVAFGYKRAGCSANPKTIVKEVINRTKDQPKEIDFSLFWDVWNRVNQSYVGEKDDQKRVYGAIAGMVAALDDPYSVFLPPSESKNFKDDLSGDFSGIGAEMEMRGGNLTVVAPLPDSPAEKAGLRAKDIVLKIDGKEVTEYSFSEAIMKIRGPEGTKVTLTIFRPPSEKPFDLVITRSLIHAKSVNWKEEDGIYIVKIRQFNFETVPLLKEMAKEMEKKGIKMLVLDLRNNPGGYLDIAREVWRLFSNEDPLLYQQDKSGTYTPLSGIGSESPFKEVVTVVLVNNGSASASEIIGSAFQDFGRGKVIGEKTYGKGSVQELQDLKDGSSLKITIARWFSPKKRAIDKVGIEPDIEVKLTEEDRLKERDPQLQKALEVLKSS